MADPLNPQERHLAVRIAVGLPELWEGFFNPNYVALGRDDSRNGMVRVHALEANEDEFMAGAAVEGSKRGQVYEVSVIFTRARRGDHEDAIRFIEGRCSCPVELDCQHAIATVLQLAEIGKEIGQSEEVMTEPEPAAPLSEPSLSEVAQLSHPAQHWAKKVGAPRKSSRYGRGSDYRLRPVQTSAGTQGEFCLHVAPVGTVEDVEPVNRGGRLRLQPVAWRPEARLADPLDLRELQETGELPVGEPEDARILLEMMQLRGLEDRSGAGEGYWFHPDRSRFWSELLGELLRREATKMLWKGEPAGRFSLSEESRALVPGWVADSAGRQWSALVFQDTGDAAYFFEAEPPLYLDVDQKTVGPATIERDEIDLAHWLMGPAILPESIPALKQVLPNSRLHPETVEFQTLGGPAVGVLTLGRIDIVQPGGYYESMWRGEPSKTEIHYRDLPVAFVDVRYGPLTFDVGKEDLVISTRFKGQHYRVERDFVSEAAITEQLDRLGLRGVRNATGFYAIREDLGAAVTFPQRKAAAMDRAWIDFLTGEVPKLRAAGWVIEVEDSFGVDFAEPEEFFTEIREQDGEGIDWMEFAYEFDFDGKRVSLVSALAAFIENSLGGVNPAELIAADEDARTAIFVEEIHRIVSVPTRQIGLMMQSLMELFEQAGEGQRARMHPVQAAQAMVSLEEMIGDGGSKRLKELGKKLAAFDGLKPVDLPATLNAALRPYQKEGVAWLQFLREHELGGILADDMGLGKTVQTIAHLLIEQAAGRLDRPVLIVAPTSVTSNWVSETKKFAPGLKTLLLQGPERKHRFDQIPRRDLVVTSYALLHRDEAALLAHDYHSVILDEAQTIKNHRSKMAITACKIAARHRLCLSGTPLENHLGELWSLFHFLMPGFLGTLEMFRARYRRPIENEQNTARQEALARRVAPLLLRRTKEHVLDDLPPRTEIVHRIPLDRAQMELYEVIRAAMDRRVKEAISDKGLGGSQIIVLDALLKLRQVCCHPQLLKTERAQSVTKSAKLNHLMGLVDELAAEGRRILIFSQFTTMLGLIERELEAREIGHVKLTGSTKNRPAVIDRFQSGKVPVFLISLKAGGTGLNLTEADTVIHYDPWWNPAVEEQATGRAHRMGQKNPVFVYRLVTEGTIEERIQELQQQKADIARSILEPGEKKAGGVSLAKEDLERLLVPVGDA